MPSRHSDESLLYTTCARRRSLRFGSARLGSARFDFAKVVQGFLFWINVLFAACGWMLVVFGCNGVGYNQALSSSYDASADGAPGDAVWWCVVALGCVTTLLSFIGFAAAWYEHRRAMRLYQHTMGILLVLW